METFGRLLRDERAQGVTEYAVVLSTVVFGVALIMYAVWNKLASSLQNGQTVLNQVPVP